MLANIHVKNMALIKEADISLGKGLNILSGETGAGKSILLGSIAVALGLQNFKGFAREDADYALSELVFVIENEEQRQALLELEIPVEDGEVIISRRLSKGRTTSKINGETVPVSMVRKAGTLLIDIHGQHENQSLLHIRKHLELLDDFAGEKLALAKEKYKARYQEYGELKKELDQAQLDNATRAKEMDFLSFEIGEIEEAALQKGKMRHWRTIIRDWQTEKRSWNRSWRHISSVHPTEHRKRSGVLFEALHPCQSTIRI